MKNIVYIHGANLSPRSFSFIQSRLPEHNILNISYSVNTPLIENTKLIKSAIYQEFDGNPVSIISHSMGGLIALNLHNGKNIDKIVTMSAPFGGSRFVEVLRWICPNYQMFADVKTTSPIIKEIKSTKYTKPILSIVTTAGGNPLIGRGEQNDGTVTVSSQLAAIGPIYEKFDLNHFEVLMSDQIIGRIDSFIF